MENSEISFVYMVKCEDGSLYTGITKDVKKRMGEHFFKTQKGAKYTKSRQVTEIMMVWEATSFSSAARLEYAIKRLTRKDKLTLIANPTKKLGILIPKLSEETYIPRTEYVMEISRLLEPLVN